MAYSALYIDDQVTDPDVRGLRDLLDDPESLICELRLPPPNLVLPRVPDVLLIDLDLSTRPPGSDAVNYYGSTLAAETRFRTPTCPIVLITRNNILIGRSQLVADSGDVDLILYKDEIIRNPDESRARIVALIAGFKGLESISGHDWQQVLQVMGADDEESDLLREAAPPLESHQWNVPQVARWIRNVVLGFPGILYDELTAATRLGIDLPSFRLSQVQQLFASAEYTGVFSSYRRCWWRDRLFGIAQQILLDNGLAGSTPSGFAMAFEGSHQQRLNQAICVYDGTPVADWVCHILQKPVKQANSLPYYPDRRPAVMDQARVSFKAIQEDSRFDERLVDADSMAVVQQLWR